LLQVARDPQLPRDDELRVAAPTVLDDFQVERPLFLGSCRSLS